MHARVAAKFIALLLILGVVEPSTSTRRPRRQPVMFVINTLCRAMPRLCPFVAKTAVRSTYQVVSHFSPDNIKFLNYGYARVDDSEKPLVLLPEDEPDRHSIQLYNAAVGDTLLEGKDVIEIGCGRGGGASFVARYFKPRKIVGLDLAQKAITFCERQHHVSGLSFQRGDAENLPFASSSFDVVLNVESSHGYPSMERFLSESFRILRSGGTFLLTDFRQQSKVEKLQQQIGDAGFIIEDVRLINANVVKALDLNVERSTEQIQKLAPRVARGWMHEFSAMPDSEQYANFASGRLRYQRFILRKP